MIKINKDILSRAKRAFISRKRRRMIFIYDNDNIEFREVKSKKIFYVMFSILMIFVSVMILDRHLAYVDCMNDIIQRYEDSIKTVTFEKKRKAMNFSEEKLIERINEYNIKYKELCLAQARLESSYYTSPVFVENNNLFGMRKAYRRMNVQCGINLNHATYDNWKMSLVDYGIFQITFDSEESYRNYLKYRYAEDTAYYNKILSIEKNIKRDKIFSYD